MGVTSRRADLKPSLATLIIASLQSLALLIVASRFTCSLRDFLTVLISVFGVYQTVHLAVCGGASVMVGLGIRARRRLASPLLGIAISLFLMDGLFALHGAWELYGKWNITTIALSLPMSTVLHAILLALVLRYRWEVRAWESSQEPEPPVRHDAAKVTSPR